MQFKTPQGQAAYAEVIAETGRIVQKLRTELCDLGRPRHRSRSRWR